MPHALAQAVEVVTTVMAVAGMGYFLASLLAARAFLRRRRAPPPPFAPGVSILKSLKGLDPGMLDAFRSHCRQGYPGEFELLCGVASLDDPAASAVSQLQAEFPQRAIRLIECPLRLGSNGKVSTLMQVVPHARYEFLLINDSDITVSPRYLERVMACFGARGDREGGKAGPSTPLLSARHDSSRKAQPDDCRGVGLVTTLYRGRAHGTLPSRLEALGIATDFQPSVLLARWIEGGLRYGLGSTLAVSREALDSIGGLASVVDYLADDYELGVRIYKAGYRIALAAEVVETSVPACTWAGFFDHQLRWYRTVRDARPWGYVGLVFTYGLGWALMNVLASGVSPLSAWLLALSFFLRVAQAMTVGAEVLGDHQVLPGLGLLPLRDLVAMGLWAAGFAGSTVVWRGERFAVKAGRLEKTD